MLLKQFLKNQQRIGRRSLKALGNAGSLTSPIAVPLPVCTMAQRHHADVPAMSTSRAGDCGLWSPETSGVTPPEIVGNLSCTFRHMLFQKTACCFYQSVKGLLVTSYYKTTAEYSMRYQTVPVPSMWNRGATWVI